MSAEHDNGAVSTIADFCSVSAIADSDGEYAIADNRRMSVIADKTRELRTTGLCGVSYKLETLHTPKIYVQARVHVVAVRASREVEAHAIGAEAKQ
jgi:hypothetical protein